MFSNSGIESETSRHIAGLAPERGDILFMCCLLAYLASVVLFVILTPLSILVAAPLCILVTAVWILPLAALRAYKRKQRLAAVRAEQLRLFRQAQG